MDLVKLVDVILTFVFYLPLVYFACFVPIFTAFKERQRTKTKVLVIVFAGIALTVVNALLIYLIMK